MFCQHQPVDGVNKSKAAITKWKFMGRVTNANEKAKRVTDTNYTFSNFSYLNFRSFPLHSRRQKKVRERIRNKQIEKDWGREENHRNRNIRRDRKTVKQSQRERHRQKDWYSRTQTNTLTKAKVWVCLWERNKRDTDIKTNRLRQHHLKLATCCVPWTTLKVSNLTPPI